MLGIFQRSYCLTFDRPEIAAAAALKSLQLRENVSLRDDPLKFHKLPADRALVSYFAFLGHRQAPRNKRFRLLITGYTAAAPPISPRSCLRFMAAPCTRRGYGSSSVLGSGKGNRWSAQAGPANDRTPCLQGFFIGRAWTALAAR
jgi:hypothetical protein